MITRYPAPHGDKLDALLNNRKLPDGDIPRVRAAIDRYEAWKSEMRLTDGNGDSLIESLVKSLDAYKRWIDLELVFDSPDDFLYRQKGQLKIDNTVLEEFLPWLVGKVFADELMDSGLVLGSVNAFSHLRFDSSLSTPSTGGNMAVRSKDHDFAIARPLFIRASHREDFSAFRESGSHLAYVAAEIKTNLDKTMFQEASATAQDLKLAIPDSRYFLMCEWLDMTPISAAVTPIEEVIILRKAKRLPASARRRFSSRAGRAANRDSFERHLTDHPFAPDAFARFIRHLEPLLRTESGDEDEILARGWF